MDHKQEEKRVELTAEVWKAMTERKSSEFFLPNERDADELRRPENSENPFPLAYNEQAARKPIRQEVQKTPGCLGLAL